MNEVLASSTLTLPTLLGLGFQLSARWQRSPADGTPRLDGRMPEGIGVYLFVDEETICYVGVTEQLHRRMRPYARRLAAVHQGRAVYGPQSRAVFVGIRTACAAGRDVLIYTFSVTGSRFGCWNKLPMDYLVGLESGLIERLNPPWNMASLKLRTARISDFTV